VRASFRRQQVEIHRASEGRSVLLAAHLPLLNPTPPAMGIPVQNR
jgi:hypothetical protein